LPLHDIVFAKERFAMNERSFFKIRAQHLAQLAIEASNPRLKAAYEAIAADMLAKAAAADPNRDVAMTDGVVVESYWVPTVAASAGMRR
jgi:hypothetical protein